MEMKVYKGKADWNSSPWGDEKICLFVEFPNCISKATGKPFRWMPTHEQVKKIQEELDDVERTWKGKDMWEVKI